MCSEVRAQLQVLRCAEHPSRDGYAVCDPEKEHVIARVLRRWPGRHVRMHLAQPGYQKLSARIDQSRALRDLDAVGYTDRPNHTFRDEHCRVIDDSFASHRNDPTAGNG